MFVTCGIHCCLPHPVQMRQRVASCHVSLEAKGGVGQGEGALGATVWGAAVLGGGGGPEGGVVDARPSGAWQ